jgi:hypothetical protein
LELIGALIAQLGRPPATLIGILVSKRIQRPFDLLQLHQPALLGRQDVQQCRHVSLVDQFELSSSHVAQLRQACVFRVDQLSQQVGSQGAHPFQISDFTSRISSVRL